MTTIRLYDSSPGLAALSVARFVAVCAYPPPREADAAERTWFAFFALLEARGCRVSLDPVLRVRRRAWTAMTPARRDQIIDATAYRLLSRRLAMVELAARLAFRPEGATREAVRAAFGRHLAAGSRVAGLYLRNATGTTPDNVRALEREACPVLHLAYAIAAELDRAELSAWDWPLLALMDGAQDRIRRMVGAADVWRRAESAEAVRVVL